MDEEMVGRRFGRLVVLEEVDKIEGDPNSRWLCQCDCGNKTIVTGSNLRSGNTKSCGCYSDEVRRSWYNDLTGQKYGRLTALEPTDDRGADGSIIWKCQCECGNITFASSNNLRRGVTKSCGCYKKEKSHQSHKSNVYIFKEDYVIGKYSNGKEFLIDKDDFDRVKDHYWYYKDGYGRTSGGSHKAPSISMHRFILNVSDERMIDHKNMQKSDNRKSNLRITNKQLNSINRGPNVNNKLGVKGVNKSQNGKRYVARIVIDGKTKYLGTFDTIEEASSARRNAEIEAFGEFAYGYEEGCCNV